MHVAAQGDHVVQLVLDHALQEALARGAVAVPRVVVSGAAHGCGDAGGGNQGGLRQQAPSAFRGGQAKVQPPFLLGAEHAALGVVELVTLRHHAATAAHRVATGLGAAVLAAIEGPEVGQLAPVELLVQTHRGLLRALRVGGDQHGLVLKVGLVSGGAAQQKLLRVGVVAVLVVGVVVDHFVVVPHQHPRMGGVRGLQVRVAFVLGVALAVLRQGLGLPAAVLAHHELRVGALVDVVAHKQHEVQRLLGNLLMRNVLAVLVMLARGQGDAQLLHIGVGSGCGAGVAHAAEGVALAEAVPIVGGGLQVLQMHMHAVASAGISHHVHFLHATFEGGVGIDRHLHA